MVVSIYRINHQYLIDISKYSQPISVFVYRSGGVIGLEIFVKVNVNNVVKWHLINNLHVIIYIN